MLVRRVGGRHDQRRVASGWRREDSAVVVMMVRLVRVEVPVVQVGDGIGAEAGSGADRGWEIRVGT